MARRGALPRGVLNLVRLLLGGALLWLVARAVPWQDQLLIGEGEDRVAYAGKILDDWKQETIRFQLEPTAVEGEEQDGVAGQLRGLLEAGAVVQVGDTELAGLAHQEPIFGSFEWRPGMPTAFGGMELSGLLKAFACLVLGSLLAATRWWRLLALIGCGRSWAHVLRLTYIGLFFNLVLPGLNGGDVARGVLVVRENPGRRPDALMSVVVDRLIGLVAMIALALLAVLSLREQLGPLVLPVSGAALAAFGGLAVLQSRRLRGLLRFESWLVRIPGGEKLRSLDQAWMLLARRRGDMALAFLLSLGNHLAVTGGVFFLGHAIAEVLDPMQYLAVVTVTNTITSVPISPGGWGLGEASFHSFFVAFGAEPTVGVAASVTYRLCNIALGLAGALALVLPGERLRREELGAVLAEEE